MLLAVIVALLGCSSLFAGSQATPLDDYVNKPDSNYAWTQLPKVITGPGYKAYIVNMTSQQWLTPQDVSRSIWWHYMFIVVPDIVKHHDTGMLYITGDSNEDSPPSGTGEDELLTIAVALTNSVPAAALFQVPNAPIVFAADPEHARRSEDAIIAFTWYHFNHIDPNSPEWLLRLPMTKAAVRALDTMSAFWKKQTGRLMDKFFVAGASKRGWTTWTTGAVDKRVIGLIPIVMDLLNFTNNIHHFWRAFGGWTFAFKDYYVLNFTADVDLPSMSQMFGIIDPYVYRDRLTMPKLVIDSCGDEFFMPDDNHYWWDDMPGEKHLLMVQDAEHSLITGLPEVVDGITAFIHGILETSARPEMTWTMAQTPTGGNMTVTLSEKPTKIFVRYADTLDGNRRDWRLITGQQPCPTIVIDGGCIHPVLWHKGDPVQTGDLTWSVSFDAPENLWRAFFFEVEFNGTSAFPYTFTTQINIIPDVFPFPDCTGAACKGTLL